jgi:hypothetical protein
LPLLLCFPEIAKGFDSAIWAISPDDFGLDPEKVHKCHPQLINPWVIVIIDHTSRESTTASITSDHEGERGYANPDFI